MKKFREISRKVVSIKTFTKRNNYVDDELVQGLESTHKSRDMLVMQVATYD